MSGRKYILGYFVIAILAGLALAYLAGQIDNIDLTLYFVILCAISFIALIITVVFRKGRKSQYILPITLVNVVCVSWLISSICLSNVFGTGTVEYLSEKLEKYRSEKGLYPRCQDFDQLSDSIGINGNEYYPEDFKYQPDKSGLFYTLTVYENDDSLYTMYDSRTKKIKRSSSRHH